MCLYLYAVKIKIKVFNLLLPIHTAHTKLLSPSKERHNFAPKPASAITRKEELKIKRS